MIRGSVSGHRPGAGMISQEHLSVLYGHIIPRYAKGGKASRLFKFVQSGYCTNKINAAQMQEMHRGTNIMTPDLAKNIEKYRQRSGMTLEQLAEKSFISLNTLKGFLYRGENDPRVSTLINLSNALDCTVNDLIGYRKDKRAEGAERVLMDIQELLNEHFK